MKSKTIRHSAFIFAALFIRLTSAGNGQPTAPILASFSPPSVDDESERPATEFAENVSDHDPFFARQGRSLVAGLTGIPYVGVLEYAHGFSDRLTVGAFGGLAVSVPGFGVRVRYIVAQPDRNFRLYAKVPLIYYPKFKGVDRWFLAWPVVNAEWRNPNGSRWWTGVGVIGSSRGKNLSASNDYGAQPTSPAVDETPPARRYGSATAEKPPAYQHMPAAPTHSAGYGRQVHAGVWNTVQLGYSRPLSHRVTFQFEAAAVLKGVRLDPTHTWVGGPPVIVTTGVSYAF